MIPENISLQMSYDTKRKDIRNVVFEKTLSGWRRRKHIMILETPLDVKVYDEMPKIGEEYKLEE